MRYFNTVLFFILFVCYNCKENNKLLLEENVFNDILPVLIFKTCNQTQFPLGTIIKYSNQDNNIGYERFKAKDFYYAINDTIEPMNSFQKQDIESMYNKFEFNKNTQDSIKHIFNAHYIKNSNQSNLIYFSKIKNYEKINKIISFSNILFNENSTHGAFYMICECPKDNCSRIFCILIKNIRNKWIVNEVVIAGIS
jgi:hypothetical protein